MECNTCHKECENLYRAVIRNNYDALNKKPFWNCKECYDKKNKERNKVIKT